MLIVGFWLKRPLSSCPFVSLFYLGSKPLVKMFKVNHKNVLKNASSPSAVREKNIFFLTGVDRGV